MRPLRAFLFAQSESGDWGCQVFRELEPLLEAVLAANGSRQHPVGVHVGFDRPDSEAVGRVLCSQDGLVYLTDGAIGTMPPPIRCSEASIGCVDNTFFHAAVDGFGYTIEGPTKVGSAPVGTLVDASKPVPVPQGWLDALAKLRPELAIKTLEAEIWDDPTYLSREARLDSETRYAVGLHRYEILESGQPDPASLISRLSSAPPWLLGVPISRLSLSVRSTNVCRAHQINSIGDFARYGLSGLYKLPSLGRKSVNEITREVMRQLITGEPLRVMARKAEWKVPEPLETRQLFDSHPIDLTSQNGTSVGADGFSSQNIAAGLESVSSSLEDVQRRVWAARLGFRCEPMTLQQIALQIGVTRERVRQIETKALNKVGGHPFWQELSQKVQEHLEGRTSPLFLAGLPAIDPWFIDAEKLAHPLQVLTNQISSLGFHVLTWNESHVISRMSQADWLSTVDEARAAISAIARNKLTEREVLSHIAIALAGRGEDMYDALQSEISQFCIWSTLSDGSRILTGFGKSAATLVLGILEASASPLHIDEIQRRARADSSYESVNAPNIRRAASEVGCLYGRGTYGLLKHCPLDASELLAVRAEVEDIVSGAHSSKQWHSSELYDELMDRGFAYQGRLTKYVVNIALKDSPLLVYLRRMVWGVRSKWSDSAQARLDVKQAIVSLLEAEGKPMTTAQIRAKLVQDRGLNVHFQIWATSPLIRLGPGVWGLEERDLDILRATESVHRLLAELEERQTGMHITEVAAYLGLERVDDVSALVSVGGREGLRMDKSQYCYVNAWGVSRRISLWDATTACLRAHPVGLSLQELHGLVERVTKRKVERQQLSSVLQNIDAVFDAETSRWRSAEGTVEEDEDEDFQPNSGLHVAPAIGVL